MTRSLTLLFPSLLVLAACGGSPGTGDLGMPIDSGGMDTGADLGHDAGVDMGVVHPPGTTCDMPMVVTGDATMRVSVTYDTTHDPEGMRDFGEHCANPDPGMGAGRFPPQLVLEYHVAGSGMQRVDVSTDNTATPGSFDTVVQVRTTCTMVPVDQFPFTCFDDVGAGNVHSSGSFTAMGGSTVYVLVTGYTPQMSGGMTTDRGPLRVDFTQHAAHAPTASNLHVYFVDGHFEMDGDGMDMDGDAVGFRAHVLGASGSPVDVNGDGTTDSYDDVLGGFATSAMGMTTFTGAVSDIAELVAAGMSAQSVITNAHGTQVALTIFDQGGLESAPVTLPIVTLPLADLGAMCDAGTRCRNPASCDTTSMTCMLPPAIMAACSGATVLAVATPAGSTTTAMASGMTPSVAMGNFVFSATSDCVTVEGDTQMGAVAGGESLYRVTVPAGGDYDLIVGTEASAAGTDTVVYVWSTCGDPRSEVACNDDIMRGSMEYRSHVEVHDAPAGDYTIFVEHYGGGAVAYTVHADLRPVIASGMPCMGGTADRCATGTCSSTHVCP